jgi:hypothetical protein
MIAVPSSYPGPDEFIVLVTRMRLIGAWDSRNNYFLDLVRSGHLQHTYGEFLRKCVGFHTHRADAMKSYWLIADALHTRGFVSFSDDRKLQYVIANKVAP